MLSLPPWTTALLLFLCVCRGFSSSPCKSKHDCSYNGACSDGVCQCYPAFTGPGCAAFNFAPVDTKLGTGMRQVDAHGLQTSSWGGSVLRADDGLLHMWAAELIDGVGIKSWISNSQVVHAVADTPSRPFAFSRKEVVFPVFAHEPTVSRAPSGEVRAPSVQISVHGLTLCFCDQSS